MVVKKNSEKFAELVKFRQQAEKCINCGLCQGVCPVYKVTGEEGTSARGKVNLIKSCLAGELDPSSLTRSLFYRCLLCYACSNTCPAGVETERLWITARQSLSTLDLLSLFKKFAFRGILAHRRIFKLLLKAVALVERAVGKKDDGFLKLFLPLTAIVGGRKYIPLISFTSFVDQSPTVVSPSDGNAEMRVGYFSGCLNNFVSADISRAVVSVLAKLGVEVVIPKEQQCCGAPAFNNGDFETARKLAKRNIEVFEEAGVDWIVTACATCGSAFEVEYSILLEDDPEFKDRYTQFEAKIKDISEFLVDVIGLDEIKNHIKKESPQRIIFHESCHLYHTRGISAQPREIINLIPGMKMAEMIDADRCCGFGGSFSVMFPKLSREITRYKVDRIIETDDDVVVASSPGCVLQLGEEIKRRHLNLVVKHPVQLLDENLRCE